MSRVKKLKIYIASSFDQITEVKLLSRDLERLGFVITEKWWERIYQVEGLGPRETSDLKKVYEALSPEEFYAKPETGKSFAVDARAVMRADVLVYLAGEDPCKHNGASVEYGIAVGLGKPCLLLGELETSVMFTPLIRCRSEVDLFNRLWVLEGLKIPEYPASTRGLEAIIDLVLSGGSRVD